MDFSLSDEQLMMQDTVRTLLEEHFPPQRVRETLDGDCDHDPELWEMLADIGVLGITTPEHFGGSGCSVLEAALIAEVAGAAALPGPLLGHQLASLALLRAGSEEQRARWLPLLASGEIIGTLAWAEPGDVWDLNYSKVCFEDGRLSGLKVHTPSAGLADIMVVGVGGGRLVLVETQAEGVRIESFDGVDRTRRLGSVTFDGVRATELPNGAEVAPLVVDAALVLLSVDAFGCASRLLQETIDYLTERIQFSTRLTQFQGVKHELANMATDLEPTRALWWYAAHALDHSPEEVARTAAIAKSHIGDRAIAIARACVDLHGAIGFTWEATVHLWYKRIIFDRAYFGGSNHHRDRAAVLSEW